MEILYEDASLTVAVKPPELLSERTDNGSGFADLMASRNQNAYVGVIHRLDRGVGGVMVYAREPRAAAKLSADIQRHQFHKEYLAVVHGCPAESTAILRDLLFHDRNRNKTFTVDRMRKGVKEAVLDYRVLATVNDPTLGILSLLSVTLHTGRTHQIRVQFASRGHTLVGDGKYGAHDHCPIALFCRSLAFHHPATGTPLRFSSKPEGPVWDLFDQLLK